MNKTTSRLGSVTLRDSERFLPVSIGYGKFAPKRLGVCTKPQELGGRYLNPSHRLADLVAEKFRLGRLYLEIAEKALVKAESTHADLVQHAGLFTDADRHSAFEAKLGELRVKLNGCKAGRAASR